MPPKKILFLHGYAQSAQIFSAKTGGLRKALQKSGYETVYVNAPLLLQGDMPHSSSTDSELYGWWPYGAPDYELETAEQTIKKELDKHDIEDVEGIVGFSQGAGLSGYLTARYKEFLPHLQWAIYFSGFKLMPERFQEHYEPKISLPTLHVLGELDTVVEESRSIKLYDSCHEDHRHLLKHQGGHFVPNSKSFVNQVVNWIAAVKEDSAKDDESGLTGEKDDKLEDMFDAIDNLGKA
ncbi:alpha/beta hydrolase [Cyberlindnera jadinii NRRL Y-1542]|uniref:Alpha/beta-hydrolase n=1 Tax=Cyberlindnera jadinii (strain ATCC 18201 / CBS 1600 / BCRC 20928 / JCM 3617 / NBRC 0987 / NRRL Y-1542) TaxID=983966 RepID=A0A1E4RZX0_CYBJN|nr:alpha/beta-hydrolase [Cyberlindnera jadinii NRRL Y-1542]ODV72793.1 alpha/beta-hydrolase [Cyberlindnera jadinii NRRL Y-1542]